MAQAAVALRRTPDGPGEYDAVTERLYLLYREIFDRGGFAAVVRVHDQARQRLALSRRSAIEAEGWIA